MGCVWIQDAAESPETDGQDDVENDFEDYEAFASDPAMLSRLSKGWTAYLVAVVQANTL
jgi:hypothetical protein